MTSRVGIIRRVPVLFSVVAWIGVALIFVAAPGATANEEAFSYKDYGDVLGAYVNSRGMVDYTAL